MNQQLLFNDDAQAEPKRQAVICSAMDGGMRIHCVITVSYLAQLGAKVDDVSEWLAAYEDYRFDIEDQLEAMIAQEAFNAAGEVELS
ncbi:DUF1488 domain-containing protein [Shewanella sp. C32]|uniref:DUF1488 domain-containing protein n=1 Tax=Shewanella electrica TaxID=515560 RepID=A0ABT2FP92_9GAMM|nr:DUF1488 domain-containing protein [Shewanella electrica]MCH1926521.1 DUF1488 domain-containing protein [Shewanella electrica]MCS4558142.1 DUF1488 domain-containing protein [Shewanella electrica]